MELTGVLKAKICMIGEAAVGKTSLIRRYVEDAFEDRYISTLGSKVSLKRIWLTPKSDPGKQLEVQLSIWDLIGERSYLESLHQEYLRGSQGIIAVCDVTRYSSFEALDQWIPAALRISGEVPIAIIVNKTDLKDQVMVLYDENEPQQKAEKYGGFAAWTSAKSGENVNPVFGRLVLGIVRRIATADAD
ncbi:MAG TPA: Rab family GTPase [Thermoplasmata archaeon]|nr:Rab family GTPase [Thermoplasmata archaeon]